MSNNKINKSSEWTALEQHAKTQDGVTLNTLFEQDPGRCNDFTIKHESVVFDYSKQRITKETRDLLIALARASNLEEKRHQMFSGAAINASENRPALHTALRGSANQDITFEGRKISDEIKNTYDEMLRIYNDLRSNDKIKAIVNIGIGGSDLGPKMVCHALKSYADERFHIEFLSNIDPVDISEIFKKYAPEETAFIICSKSFGTQETIANAITARTWAQNALDENWATHFYAITGQRDKAINFGVPKDHLLPLPDWVGGRYSLWGSIGLSILCAVGQKNFEAFLCGARVMDEHFKTADLSENIPVMMALTGIWNINFLGLTSKAVLPYASHLHFFPPYIQQMDMESNGKSVDINGDTLDYATGPVIFGETGTNGQHAFYQLLHQGTKIIPCDFIAFIKNETSFDDQHDKLLTNALGQARALMTGKNDKDEPHRNFDGNRPSSTILLNELSPYALGQLISMYEHQIFVQGAVWNINSFDQWGVELGKKLADNILNAMKNSSDNQRQTLDSSTLALLDTILSLK